jgi:hypothetical protein
MGQEVRVGSIVVAPDSKTSMFIGRVIKITPKQLRLENLDIAPSTYRREPYKYHHEVVCLDQMQETVMYLLKRGVN